MVTQPNLIGMTVPGGSEAFSAMRPLGWDIPPTEALGVRLELAALFGRFHEECPP